MVTVLGLDSAGNACSAALVGEGGVLARRFAAMERGQAEALLPMVAAVLAEAGRALASLDLIAVTTGPGAFTGLRIGLAAARGLALASGVPLMGITSFAAVAAQVTPAERAGRSLAVALDSKRAELYLQSFDAAGEILTEGALVVEADWPSAVPAGPLLLAGDGAPRLKAALGGRDLRLAAGGGLADAAAVAGLAAARWRPGSRPPPPRPLYLRAPDTTLPRRGGGRP